MRSTLAILFLIIGLTSSLDNDKAGITVYLVGDSTMSIKRASAFPETGWGMPFVQFFDSTVTIENHARNGRSTRSFIEEGRWDPILEKLQPGDYVFVQFGHNDEVPSKATYTKPEEFQKYLRKYVNETRSKEAIPILLTPVSRRRFDDSGKQVETHEQYSELLREVAKELDVPLIDIDRKSQALFNSLGEDKSTLLFLHLEKGQNPNYPNGVKDNTHFNETGARMIAELVLKGIQEEKLGLSSHIKRPEDK